MRLKIMGLCLVAVFAMAAVASASASAAEPAFFSCQKLTSKPFTGKYTDKKCSKEATTKEVEEGKKNKYELVEGDVLGKEFKGKGGKATLHTPAVGGIVECKSFADKGKITSGKHEANVTSTFTACTSLGKKCTSPGAKAGSIVTKKLEGDLGYINAAKHEVGVDLKAEGGTILAEFNCEGLEIVVTGSVIGKITPTNTFSKSNTTTFKVNGEGFQEDKKLEGQPNDVLESLINGSGPFESGQEASALNKGDELNLKA
jgi:hypothetical protein